MRSSILLKIADKMEENLELLALAETLDNGKPIRETRAADVPLSIDHFRYFAGCVGAEEGALSEIDNDTIAYHFKEPLGVVGQIIPREFPAAHGRVEARTRDRGRKLRGNQTGFQHSAQPAGADGADW
jgi:acyl-CoA reductase-like NAD-dependent aldehyde dehydrogenase